MYQFKALAKKNWLQFIRNPLSSFLQILLPIALFTIVLIIRHNVSIDDQYFSTDFTSNDTIFVPIATTPNKSASKIFYLKDCQQMEIVALTPRGNPLVSKLKERLTAVGYEVKQYQDQINLKNDEKICFGVNFLNTNKDYKYTLRFRTSETGINPNEKLTLDSINSERNFLAFYKAVQSGISGITTIINSIILQEEVPKVSDTNLIHIMSPIDQTIPKLDNFYLVIGGSIGLIIILPLLLVFVRQVALMVTEKENQIKANLYIMGMRLKYYYLAWFLRYFIIYLFISFAGSAIMSSVINSVSYFIPFLIFLLFSIVLIVQGLFIQVFFTRAVFGAISACLFFSLQSSFITFIQTQQPSISLFQAISVVPHVAVSLAFREMIYADSEEIQVEMGKVINYYTINTCITSLICNIVFWSLIGLYFEQIIPNNWRKRKQICFCCNCCKNQSYVLDQASNNKDTQMPQIVSEKRFRNQAQHGLDQAQKRNIKIKKLTKKYDQMKVVSNFSVDFYSSEIFVLLGHNGAGKTTLISMLTGVEEPSQGQIEILQYKNFQEIRQSIGICPNQNPLFEDLTVRQHLELYGSMKGLNGQKLEEEIDRLICDIELQEKIDELASNLSGGQKRKLTVIISFMGDSKVIIMDEPTGGIDISARRNIWQMLKNYKTQRTILITTHLMDEAEYLADRIGIMFEGELRFCGSNQELKRKYGFGYNLTFVKKLRGRNSQIMKCIQSHVPEAQILSQIFPQLKVQLPSQTQENFARMFRQIEENKVKWNIKSYGISSTTLQEIFLRINNSESEQSKSLYERQIKRQDKNQKIILFQSIATIKKRGRILKRDYKSILFEIILPCIFLLLGLILVLPPFIETFPKQELNYQIYAKEKLPVNVPISTEYDKDFLGSLRQTMQMKYGTDLNVSEYYTDRPEDFLKKQILPMKTKDIRLKGGIYFNNYENEQEEEEQKEIEIQKQTQNQEEEEKFSELSMIQTNKTKSDNSFIPFVTFVNSQSPTSFITVQTLAAETYINSIEKKNISITVLNHPLPQNRDKEITQRSVTQIVENSFGVGIFSIALAFKFASIAFILVKQRETGSKNQQIISGMSLCSYWVGNFIFDYLTYLLLALFAILMCFAFQIEDFIGESDFVRALCALFFIYGVANILFTYVLSYLFDKSWNALIGIFFLNFMLGGIFTILIIILKILNNNMTSNIAWFLRLFPAFSFGEGIINLGSRRYLEFYANTKLSTFSTEIVLYPIIYLVVTSIFYLLILIFIENICSCLKKILHSNSETEKEFEIKKRQKDVAEEEMIVRTSQILQYEIIAKNLTKVYPEKIAVNNLSFKVDKGEIFGLLGTNGAGKSTTFKLLTNQIEPSDGKIYFQGMDLNNKQNLQKIRRNMGYCAQTDPLIDFLSVREQLSLYYDIKALNRNEKEEIIDEILKELDLKQHQNKLSCVLSTGNKRRLTLALGIVGNPSVIYLDEPSTGLDPKAKRVIWKIINRISSQRKQSTIILTTHSMDEAEFFSTKIAIMINGNFRCIGSPQNIKEKYGQGYEIQIRFQKIQKKFINRFKTELGYEDKQKISHQQVEKLCKKERLDQKVLNNINEMQFIRKKQIDIASLLQFYSYEKKRMNLLEYVNECIGKATILEYFQFYLKLKILPNIKIGEIFELLEKKRKKLQIAQYSINQTSIEQIMNKLIRQHRASSIIE